MIIDCRQCAKRHVILDRSPETIARCDCGAEFALKASSLETGVLKCGNCGGNPPLDASHCPYCDAHLAKLRCGRCMASSIEGDLHCRACGHLLSSPVRQRPTGLQGVMECPRCDGAMNAILVGDAVVDECTRCGGSWLAHDVFEEILRSERDRTVLTNILRELDPTPTTRLGTHDTRGRPETEERFYVNCPQCAAMMDRRQFARISGVVVDVCRAHGVWFDRDELPRIVQYVGDGSLQRNAKKLYEQRVASLERLQARATRAASPQPDKTSLSSGIEAVDLIGTLISLLVR